MKLEDQVCSLESAKRLKELGCVQESLFYWSDKRYHRPSEPEASIILHSYLGHYKHNECRDCYSAYTTAELGEMLKVYRYFDVAYYSGDFKEHLPEWNRETGHWCSYIEGRGIAHADTEAEARAKMLIHLIENGIVEVKK